MDALEFRPIERTATLGSFAVRVPAELFAFQGHFPGQPIMPGVLIIEAMAQAGGVLTQLTLGRDAQSKLFYMVKVDKARFTKQVVPGDVLEMHVEIKRVIRNMAVYDCVAKVDGEVVACAEVLCAGTRE